MTISFECPACFRRLKVPDKAAGRNLKCPACEASVPVPSGDEKFDDDTEEPTLPPPRRSSAKAAAKRAKSADKASAQAKTGRLHPAIIPSAVGVACLLIGGLISWMLWGGSAEHSGNGELQGAGGNSTEVVNAPAQADAPTQTNAPVPADLPAAANSPKDTVQQMITTLEKRDLQSFVLNFAPVDMLRQYQDERLQSQILTSIRPADLAAHLKALADTPFQQSPTALTAQATLTTQASATDTNQADTSAEGYGPDLPAALTAAIGDIESGRVQDFALKMFPAEALQVMTSGPEGSNRLDSLKGESAIVRKMLADLKALTSLTPTIQEDVAEYTMSPIELLETERRAVRPNSKGLAPPGRRVRFSLINGHWKFYAGISSEQLARTSSSQSTQSINLERIGPGWRLSTMPRY